MIVFLHTSTIHVSRFNKVLDRLHYKGKVEHFVNESLLKGATELGKIDEFGFKTQIKKIRAKTDALIICTCSTYGALTKELQGVVRIDEPLANYMVRNYSKIGVAYTALSTVEVTMTLLNTIDLERKNVVYKMIDCTTAWQFLENGDMIGYNDTITKTVLNEASGVEAVYLAQASMDGVEDFLSEKLNKEVLSSSFLGVKEYLK
jgi:hypothetical protein